MHCKTICRKTTWKNNIFHKTLRCYLVPDDTADALLLPYPLKEDTHIVNPKYTTIKVIPVNREVRTDSEYSDSSEEDSVVIIPEEELYCTIYHRRVAAEHQGLVCDNCDQWSHRYCLKMTKQLYNELTKVNDLQWLCPWHQVEEEPPDVV